MTAGDMTVGYTDSVDTLDADLVTASVTLAGKPGELHLLPVEGGVLKWVYIVQA